MATWLRHFGMCGSRGVTEDPVTRTWAHFRVGRWRGRSQIAGQHHIGLCLPEQI